MSSSDQFLFLPVALWLQRRGLPQQPLALQPGAWQSAILCWVAQHADDDITILLAEALRTEPDNWGWPASGQEGSPWLWLRTISAVGSRTAEAVLFTISCDSADPDLLASTVCSEPASKQQSSRNPDGL